MKTFPLKNISIVKNTKQNYTSSKQQGKEIKENLNMSKVEKDVEYWYTCKNI